MRITMELNLNRTAVASGGLWLLPPHQVYLRAGICEIGREKERHCASEGCSRSQNISNFAFHSIASFCFRYRCPCTNTTTFRNYAGGASGMPPHH
jgi:hypothetical protein